MIKLRNIEKCYRSGAQMNYVLRQINIDIAEGEFVTIMGPAALKLMQVFDKMG